jgi:hypothetical protein
LLSEPRDRIEGVTQAGPECPALIGELELVGVTAEERKSEMFF